MFINFNSLIFQFSNFSKSQITRSIEISKFQLSSNFYKLLNFRKSKFPMFLDCVHPILNPKIKLVGIKFGNTTGIQIKIMLWATQVNLIIISSGLLRLL